MIPVSKSDDGGVVVHIVEVRMRVIGVVDHKGATETIAVLGRQVRVVPERASLIRNIKVVQELVAGGDRALVNECRTIGPIGALLEETMPVLLQHSENIDRICTITQLTMEVDFNIVVSVSWLLTLIWKFAPFFTMIST
jgi:hypothetical protein